MALWIIGPRQMIASSSFSWKNDMDMTFTPKRDDGWKRPSSSCFGPSEIRSTRVTLGQSISQSKIATFAPSCASMTARLTATVVLPTPPLPL